MSPHVPSAQTAGARRDTRGDAGARLYGAAEALSVLERRGPADRQEAARHAAELLVRHVGPADWPAAGPPVPVVEPAEADATAPAAERAPAGDRGALRLAHTAMSLRCSTLRAVERAPLWAGMAEFFAQVTSRAEPLLCRMQSVALDSRLEIGEASQEVVDGLSAIYEWYRDTYGHEAYLTSLGRTNLARAYRLRGAGTDLADAEDLFRDEIAARTSRYGAEHPFALVARNMLARCLLARAEAASDPGERRSLARQAYVEADSVRAARDLLYGVTASNAVLSRRLQGHALLLLGGPEDLHRARACLQYVLAFETARNGNTEWRGSGQTHLLLARAYLALGDKGAALHHAGSARRLLVADNPGGASCRKAEALLHELRAGETGPPRSA